MRLVQMGSSSCKTERRRIDKAVEPEKRGIAWAVRGAFKAGKALVGADKASDDVIAERLAICGQCPNWTGKKCRLCGCNTSLKVRLAGESCPDKPPRWGTASRASAGAG